MPASPGGCVVTAGRPVTPARSSRDRQRRLVVAVAVLPAAALAALTALLASRGWTPFGFERSADAWSASHRPAPARTVAAAITSLGSGAVPYLLALAAGAVALRALPPPRAPRRAVLLLTAPLLWLLAGQAVRLGLMQAFARPRPPRPDWATAASGYSYPSGHSFTSTVCAGLLAMAVVRARPAAAAGRAVVAAAALFAALVGLSRVYLGVHWPLDVLGGWLLGCIWLAVGSAVLPRVPGTGPPPVARGSGEAPGA
ncbi:phosphatase PAP2 family protein [Kitasatospora sp. NPDC048194]|uniref:phosphatase PAP2 family protein n=1 Tax=Kitasatospora sp. NPDC048194 TaxID=3364045 RepID=UPI0037188B7F